MRRMIGLLFIPIPNTQIKILSKHIKGSNLLFHEMPYFVYAFHNQDHLLPKFITLSKYINGIFKDRRNSYYSYKVNQLSSKVKDRIKR